MDAFKWENKSEHYTEAHCASVVLSVGHYHETDYKMELSFSGGTIYREVYGDDLEQAKRSATIEVGKIVKELREDWMAIVRNMVDAEDLELAGTD